MDFVVLLQFSILVIVAVGWDVDYRAASRLLRLRARSSAAVAVPLRPEEWPENNSPRPYAKERSDSSDFPIRKSTQKQYCIRGDPKGLSACCRHRGDKILTLGLGLTGYMDQAHAQFGATGGGDLPTFFVFGPWIILLAVILGSWRLYPAGRPRLCKAMRRALFVYTFVEIVPISVCLLLMPIFNMAQSAGLFFWVVSMMGVVFSGIVLSVFILAALILDWVFDLCRKEKEHRER
ncbi:hypothetical protein O8B93_21940 [Agrobacterium rhizogenes]|uniref:hypothetical protein n=1 Tax=Rhizobium rhizogenes TaxID=359 RepID=UPI0022B6642F|nr:hypothetical protein [Rhizobium rhizogenes]MCZ7450249.1 hypothetical protein [Rhizobium rhizogenes]